MPAISSIIVSPLTAQTTSTQISPVASGPSTSQAVVPSVMPSFFSTMLITPLSGCASRTVTKLSVDSPTTKGRKKTVRNNVEPRRLRRTRTASA